MQTGHKRNDAMIADFCDCNIFKTHPLFLRDPSTLQLMLYYDEVEISNPLGTKTGKHKVGKVILESVKFTLKSQLANHDDAPQLHSLIYSYFEVILKIFYNPFPSIVLKDNKYFTIF